MVDQKVSGGRRTPDIIFENAQRVSKEIEAKGGQALAINTDISDEASTQEMIKKTVK
ncbi:hypothetical protein ACFLTK_01000 [Chloroflexota bacterium]